MRTIILSLAALAACHAECVVQDIGPDATSTGTLAAGCRARDLISGTVSTAYAAGYRLRLTGPTVLTARMSSPTFNTFLYITTLSGSTVAINDDADGTTNSRITVSLNPGTYNLVATSRNISAGEFTLTTSSEAPRACPVRDVSGSSLSGTFTDTGCRALDLRFPSTDDRPVDRYRVSVSRRSVVSVEMTSSDFDTYLELWKENGTRMTSDHAGAGPRSSRMLSSLEPGAYVVYAYPYQKATGAYLLSPSVDALRNCPVKDLVPGDAANPAVAGGTFTQESCRILDLLVPSDDESYVEPYRVTLAKKSVVTVKQQSSAVDSYLAITSADYESIFENEDESAVTANAAILGSLASGTYIILATESQRAPGPYSLSVAAEDPRPCPVRDLPAGETLTGTLSDDSCRWLDLIVPSEETVYVAPLRVTLAKRSVVTLDLDSPSMDTYLVLATPQYKSLFENDDADDSTTDSQIVGSLQAGTYIVLATTYDLATGPYTAALAVEDPRACPAKDIGPTDSVTGTLTNRSCRYLDLVSPSDDSTPLDLYRLTAAAKGVLSLDMTATGFSPWLALTNGDYENYYQNDGDTQVKADLLVLPGTYYIIANTMDNGGKYTLNTKFGPPRECPAPTLGLQETQRGTLSQSACRFGDFVPFSGAAAPANQHRITVLQRGTVQIKAASTDFVPIVLLANEANTNALAVDVNRSGSPTAEVSATVNPGNYNVIVLTLGTNLGGYDVSTSFTATARPE